MIIQASKLIGLKVITLEKGEQVEDIDDVLYSPQDHRVKGFLVKPGGIISQPQVILLSDIKSIGTDAVMIDSKEVLKSAKDAGEDISSIAKANHFLTQTKIVTDQGVDLGSITDIFFDSQTGETSEFEVTQGAIKDIQGGRKRIRPMDIVTVGKDATIVRGFTETALEQQAQKSGVQGAVNQVKETAEEKGPQVMEEIKEKAAQAKDTIEDKVDDIKTDQKTKEFKSDLEKQAMSAKLKAQETAQYTRQQMGSLGGQVQRSNKMTLPRGSEVKLPDGTQLTVKEDADLVKK